MQFALVAGEISGDILGAALIRALRQRYPAARFYGVAGPRMIAAGCEAIESIEALSLMGIAEVLPALPRLLRLRAQLVKRFAADRPDAVIGIDTPDFNLGLERRLRQRGLKTVHVVSPSVWAWRQGRVKGIARAVDLMLCLLPFEPAFYAGRSVQAAYIGHPLADELDDTMSPAVARSGLGITAEGPVVAGDALYPSIMAASIIAKVLRDREMERLDQCYPGYGLAQHKGYGTEQHLRALRELGPTVIHRRSFAPVAQYSLAL